MTWLVHFARVWVSQTLQICGSVLNRPIGKKTKERQRANRETDFVALGDLVRSSNKVFIESQRLFFCQQKEDMVEWLRDRLCNVTEIKNIEMIQSFLVERSWNQWLLSKKVLCTRRCRRKKMFSEIWQQSQGSQNSRTERKVGSVKQHGGLWKLIRWLKSLAKFSHNILRKI